MFLTPNAHSDYKTQMANYKSLASFLHQKGYDTALAPNSNGWEMVITNPKGKSITIHPRDILEATRILYGVANIVNESV
jgi:hypothetical protein